MGAGAVDDGVGSERANVARMYDYMLGGARNFAADRELVEEVSAQSPGLMSAVWALRHFMRRSVRIAVGKGIDQFLDLGSGLPTVGNVHEVARTLTPSARVAYVDSDPVAVAEGANYLAGTPGVSITRADLTDADTVLDAPGVADLLDFERPVAVLILSVLHFVPDADQVRDLVARYRRRLVPGSALVISHGSDDYDDPCLARRVRNVQRMYARSARPTTLRTRAELAALFEGTDLVEPGVVDLARWRPDTSSGVEGDPGPVQAHATGVGAYAAMGIVSPRTGPRDGSVGAER